MKNIKIVLVEPAGALNIGSIARVMKNIQLTQLVLVNPQCDPVGKEARLMAVHAQDVLDNAVIVDSLPAALQGCQRAIATTARSRSLPTALETPRQALPWLVAPDITSAVIFGSEERGLSNQELNYGQRFVCIPTNPEYSSLNLAQAVAICGYELYQTYLARDFDEATGSVVKEQDSVHNSKAYARLQDDPIARLESPVENAPVEAIEAYYDSLQSLLLEIGFLYPHTVAARMAKVRRIYNRANLKLEEVSLLRGMLRQIRWAIDRD